MTPPDFEGFAQCLERQGLVLILLSSSGHPMTSMPPLVTVRVIAPYPAAPGYQAWQALLSPSLPRRNSSPSDIPPTWFYIPTFRTLRSGLIPDIASHHSVDLRFDASALIGVVQQHSARVGKIGLRKGF